MVQPLKYRAFKAVYVYLLFSGILLTKAALAYLDPGNMSFFVQIIIAALLGLPLAFTQWFKKLFHFLSSPFKRKKSPPTDKK